MCDQAEVMGKANDASRGDNAGMLHKDDAHGGLSVSLLRVNRFCKRMEAKAERSSSCKPCIIAKDASYCTLDTGTKLMLA